MSQTTKAVLNLELANRILAAAMEKASTTRVRVNIAVIDAGTHLTAFCRMDGALPGEIDIAITKARTACLFEAESGSLGESAQPGGSLYGIENSNGGLITFSGGVPIRMPDGTVIGAIGVSGSTVENDRAVALAGVAIGGPLT